jgi:WD40 repeat protein
MIRIWSLPDGALVREWRAHDGLSLALYSPNGRYLLTAGADGIARIYDARSGAEWSRRGSGWARS